MKRLVACGFLLSVGFTMDAILWRMYANDKRIMKRHEINGK